MSTVETVLWWMIPILILAKVVAWVWLILSLRALGKETREVVRDIGRQC